MRCCSLLMLMGEEEARYFFSTYLALMKVEMVLRRGKRGLGSAVKAEE